MICAAALSGCKKGKDKPTVAPPVRVTVEVVTPTNTGVSQSYSGTVSSASTTTVSFSVPGTITALYAKEGDKVSQGQVLGKVKSGDYENARNIAEAELAEAQDAYDRLKKLHDANALPDIKWVEIQQKLKQAKNSVEIADRALSDATLKSPVSGTVSRKFADKGQTVISVEPIYEIISAGDLEIEIPVSENEVAGFSNGQKASVIFGNNPETSFEGKIVSKSVTADPLTRSYTIKISLPGSSGKILPGMVGTVLFAREEAGDSIRKMNITLPSQAVLLSSDNRNFVWTVKDGKAERRFVEVDELVPYGVSVTSGLVEGDSVIVEGMQKVGSGSEVISLTK